MLLRFLTLLEETSETTTSNLPTMPITMIRSHRSVCTNTERWCLLRAAVLLGFSAAVCAADVPVATVCDLLADPDGWSGKVVLLVGHHTSTNEGEWLYDTCPQHV